ncbi:MAG: methyl-accepting chemotaxis protein [Gammaproteobacteria bacterium]|nr:methyl-accepting chemotaxis protein [Gammaproteobacteria bacterium]
MFNNIKISRRLIILISILTLIFLSTGAVTLIGLSTLTKGTESLNQKTAESAEFSRISGSVRYHMVDVGQQLASGALTWSEAARLLESGAQEFDSLWQSHEARIAGNSASQEFFNDTFGIEVGLVRQGFEEFLTIVKAENRGHLSLFLLNDARTFSDPFLDAADALSSLGSIEAQAVFDQSEQNARLYNLLSLVVVVVGVLAAAILGPMIYLSITAPINSISSVVRQVADGNLEARTGLSSRDELGQLGQAFDGMLNERVASMTTASEENERLNDSVIQLLEAVSDLSNRDLTVNVPVAEDVTGPVADAMNLMARQTAQVLSEIRTISNQVAGSATTVESQGGKINQLADEERQIIEDTMTKLDEAAKTMNLIARQAKASNDIASKATVSTQEALEKVAQTANGMNEIRETISETEKRIKRLGERSQEINGVVEIINNIAERTHILALNASMQAAAAGDAGRGFAVVANEVQRLAESSRDSTSEIAGLVGNIQAETAETMATMNKAIAQVVEGSELAQASGVQMQATQQTTAELVSAVEVIAKRSLVQAHVNNKLRDQTEQAQKSTQDTNAELKRQADETGNLVQFSRQLLDSINVFKLPAA